MAKGYAANTNLNSSEAQYPYNQRGFELVTMYGGGMAQVGYTVTVSRIEDDDTLTDIFVMSPPVQGE